MSLETITSSIQQKMALADGLDATVKLDFGDDGIVFVDATASPPTVSNDDEDADLTLITSVETFKAILTGDQDPNIAFMMGKLKVKGPMGLAMKLNAILED
jgi:putative sterol carrier protein